MVYSPQYMDGNVNPRAMLVAYDESALDAIEFAGRLCYLSFDRPNPETDTPEKYARHILEVGHVNLLAHASASFIICTERGISHELVRHRHFVYSQVSSRYVDYSPYLTGDEKIEYDEAYEDAVDYDGLTGKLARERAARVLRNSAPTCLVMTGNLHAWYDMLPKRVHPTANARIRILADQMVAQLRATHPVLFDDPKFGDAHLSG